MNYFVGKDTHKYEYANKNGKNIRNAHGFYVALMLF